jgi:hypothetical protein
MIVKKQPRDQIVLDMTGPDGNAFALLAYAKRFAKQLGYDYKQIQEEMTKSDYENLVNVFDSYFGDYVILEF